MKRLALRFTCCLRTGFAAAALILTTAAQAQLPPCSELPPEQREPARLAGRCAGFAPIIDMRPPAAPAASPTEAAAPLANVVGMSFDAARASLAGFEVLRVYQSSLEPGGTIIAQDPAAGARLAAGSRVRLTVSDGSQLTAPRVIGLNVNEARQRLAASGDLRSQTVLVTSPIPPGIVISQQPAEGEPVRRSGMVRLQVSAGPPGPEVFEVPNVVGMTSEQAAEQLARFRIQIQPQPSNRPTGVVLQQTPPRGRLVADSPVTLVVSAGRWTEIYDMPQVVGRSGTEAEALLAEFTVDLEPVVSAEPRWQVLAQNPAPGSGVVPGSRVRVQVSDGSLIRVPEVTQQTLDEARAVVSELRGVRLVVATDGGRDQGRIAWQQPAAGAEVARGTDLVVGLGQPNWSLVDRITGSDGGQGNLGPIALGMVFALLLLTAMAVLWRRRMIPPPPRAERAVYDTPPAWSAAARVDRPPDGGVGVSGAAPRGPEIGIGARIDRGPAGSRADDEP
jgi:beta-lactam-binding protein with PASTA domain